MPVTTIGTIEELEAKLKEAGDHLVVVDFFATWCGPCMRMAPKFEELSKEHEQVIFLKVDSDESPDLVAKYDINSLPTFFFFKKGEVLESFPGADYQKLVRLITTHSA